MNNNKKYSHQINLNLNVRGLPQSATLHINERSNKLIQEGRKIYKLGLGQSPFPVPKTVVEALQKNAYQKDYLPVKGLYKLREAVAEYHSRGQDINHSADDVLIGPGSKELMFLLQLVYYGDLVIPTPSWVSYAPQAHIIGRHVRWLPTQKEEKWLLSAGDLIEHCKNDPDKPRIVILNYPSNPVGITYSTSELKEIALVAKQHKIILLSDEIYGELTFKGNHTSIAQFYPEGTIISGGLSKWCGAGGWRLGTFTFPPTLRWLLDSMSVVASETFTATSAPIQNAAVTAFKGGKGIDKYLWRARWILEKLGSTISEKLKSNGIFTVDPSGGFYLFVSFDSFKDELNLKGITTSEILCDRLLDEKGVAILPGTVFGRPPEELTARIAYVNFNGNKAMEEALHLHSKDQIDDKFVKKYCIDTLKAIDLIYEWIQNI